MDKERSQWDFTALEFMPLEKFELFFFLKDNYAGFGICNKRGQETSFVLEQEVVTEDLRLVILLLLSCFAVVRLMAPWGLCENQRTTWGPSSPSTIRDLGIKFRSLDLVGSSLTR